MVPTLPSSSQLPSPADTGTGFLPSSAAAPLQAPLPSSVLLVDLIPGLFVLIYLFVGLYQFHGRGSAALRWVGKGRRDCTCHSGLWRIIRFGRHWKTRAGRRYTPLVARVASATDYGVESDAEGYNCPLSDISSRSPSPPPPSPLCESRAGQPQRQVSHAATESIELSTLQRNNDQYAVLQPHEGEEWEGGDSDGISRQPPSGYPNDCHNDPQIGLSRYFDPTTLLLRSDILSSLDPPLQQWDYGHGHQSLATTGLNAWVVDWIVKARVGWLGWLRGDLG